jgi:hypothetical protein
MTDNKPAADVTKDWQATQGQKSAATRLRLFAALSWIVAIGGQIAGVVFLYQHKFDHGNLALLIGILVGISYQRHEIDCRQYLGGLDRLSQLEGRREHGHAQSGDRSRASRYHLRRCQSRLGAD